MIGWIIFGIISFIALFIVYSACVVAGRADRASGVDEYQANGEGEK